MCGRRVVRGREKANLAARVSPLHGSPAGGGGLCPLQQVLLDARVRHLSLTHHRLGGWRRWVLKFINKLLDNQITAEISFLI